MVISDLPEGPGWGLCRDGPGWGSMLPAADSVLTNEAVDCCSQTSRSSAVLELTPQMSSSSRERNVGERNVEDLNVEERNVGDPGGVERPPWEQLTRLSRTRTSLRDEAPKNKEKSIQQLCVAKTVTRYTL